jgi:RNA polymerase sigma-70 factor (ECF subfamily)
MPDERQLLRGLRQLDPETITEIHNRFFPEVYRYAQYRIGDPIQAEDIAGETFIRLLDAIHARKGPRSSLRGWLMSTTSNLVNDHFRSSYKRPTAAIPDDLASTGTSPDLSAERADLQRMLRLALAGLPTSQQHVLALRFGSGCSLAETAEIMGKKPNAVKQLQHRALQALRKELGGLYDA